MPFGIALCMSLADTRDMTTTRDLEVDEYGTVTINGEPVGAIYQDGGSWGYESNDGSVSEWFSLRSDAIAFAKVFA
jgi:hypothetical protein